MIAAPRAAAPALGPEQHRARLTSPSRLAALHASGLLDGTVNPVLDRLTRLAAGFLGVPIALVSLVDDQGQHFPGMTGLGGWAAARRGTPLSYSFCQHVVASERPFVVDDASMHPLVMENLGFTELGVVAYAGVPLRTVEGETLGALCAVDTVPVHWTPEQIATLEDLAAAAMAEVELRSTMLALLASRTQLEAAHERLRVQAVHDGLTGLLNRRGFAEASRQQVALATRTGTPLLVVALDLDGFKQINDTHGHSVGDAALVEMAVVLKATCRTSDLVARLGGDEFVLMLMNTPPGDADKVRARLDAALAARNAEPGREYALVTSIGIVAWEPDASGTQASIPALLQAADLAMYAHKRAGRAPVPDTTAAERTG